ncbi:Iron transport multicopper oxidase FET3 [Cytospora mali]|uniref:Iron transport multicopper oxidase FET3 n=1 Tax=Cytospora mali TaxID=578113 RepID=A0A194WCG2_CYTMA|nr:Iron transport multicopper oxidase FET3 [Valsa mali]
MRMPCTITILLALAGLTLAATVEVYWDITWVDASPDGYSRPVIGINGVWPCPKLEATVGDTIIAHVNNKLGNETTGVHWHGISQKGTPEMDGPDATTQCGIPPGSSATYKFLADKPGTYWYHSHEMGQYPDGLRGPLIIHDPEDPYKGQVDEEVVLTCTDWYHSQSIPLVQAMLQPSNTQFLPPIPDSILLNEGGSNKIFIQKGKTYRLRIINFSAFASCMVHFNSHPMKVIMQDGSYITETVANQLRLVAAQRYDVLISASNSSSNYPFLFSLDINPDYHNPFLGWNYNKTGYLIGDASETPTSLDVVDVWNPADDSLFTNPTGTGPYGPLAQTITLDFTFCFDNYSIPRACFNGQPYVPQLVPSLYTAATTGDDNDNPIVYGGVNPYIAPSGQVIDIVINNLDTAIHPFHLHGHHFQVLDRPAAGAGKYSGSTANFPAHPGSKDTISVNGNSYAVLRFVADNPGVWLFHCHIEWHVEMGLTATIVEAPEQLRGRKFPEDHIELCKVQGLPYEGNAAGNTENYTDTAGMLFVNSPTYTGALYEPKATEPPAARSRIIRRRV